MTVDHQRGRGGWTFLTNHAHVLICITEEPDIRGRDIASRVGVTERAAQAIIADLVAAGYVQRRRDGRRNHYSVNPDAPMRHPLDQGHTVRELYTALGHWPVAPSRSEAGRGADGVHERDTAGVSRGDETHDATARPRAIV